MYGYVEATLISPSGDILSDLLKGLQIEDAIPLNDLHMTMMYDVRNAVEQDLDHVVRFLAVPTQVVVLGQGKWQSVALSLYAPKADKFHQYLKEQGFQHSYPDFLPHISLKYRPSLSDIERLMQVEEIFMDIPLFFEVQPYKVLKDD